MFGPFSLRRIRRRPSASLRRRSQAAAARQCRPRLESLETRDLPSGTAANEAVAQAYGQLPLSFEANEGQTDAQVRFLARGQGYGLFLTSTEAVLGLRAGSPDGTASTEDVLRLRLVGASANPAVGGRDRQEGVSNYLLGNDPSRWHTDVPHYGQVAYHDVYPGIDLVYYGNQGQLEYDFVVAPGADPGMIRLGVEGARGLELDAAGNLLVHAVGGDVVEHAPILYQEGPAGRQPVAGRFLLMDGGQVGFRTDAYDPARPLVIDPTLVYSTYLGGTGDDKANAIALDASGNAYIAGSTNSTNFPTTAGAFQTTFQGGQDAFVAKLNASGTALAYSTYLGGSGDDSASAIAVDGSGNAYIAGSTGSTNFPTTIGAFQPSNQGGQDAFVAKLNAIGTALVYSTYLGGTGNDGAFAIAVDGSGHAYVAGGTDSANFFPTTAGAYQPLYGGGLYDAFVAKLNATGTALVYSTYLGGTSYDIALAIAVDASGNAYVAGYTNSSDFPTTPGAFQTINRGGGSDAFVTRLDIPAAAAEEVFVIGVDDQVYGQKLDAGGNPLGGYSLIYPGRVRALSTGSYSGKHEVFVIGLDDQVYAEKLDAADNPLGGYFLTTPGRVKALGAGSYGIGNPELFVIGLDDQVWAQKFNGSGNSVGGYFLTTPGRVLSLSAGSYASGHPEVFVIGLDYQVYAERYDGNGNALGTYFLTTPGLVKALSAGSYFAGDPVPEVFVIGLDDQVYAEKFNASGNSIGGYDLTTPGRVLGLSAGWRGLNQPAVFVIGLDLQVYEEALDDAGNSAGGYRLTTPGRVKAISVAR